MNDGLFKPRSGLSVKLKHDDFLSHSAIALLHPGRQCHDRLAIVFLNTCARFFAANPLTSCAGVAKQAVQDLA